MQKHGKIHALRSGCVYGPTIGRHGSKFFVGFSLDARGEG
jgi:hypothetical protein